MQVILKTMNHKGAFPLDLNDQPLTALEWEWVKKISGYLPLTIDQGLSGGDPSLFVAMATIALVRNGRTPESSVYETAQQLKRAPFDGESIVVDLTDGEEAADADPPAPATTPEPEPPTPPTGGTSSATSEPPANDPSPTGHLALATPADSAPPTSAA